MSPEEYLDDIRFAMGQIDKELKSTQVLFDLAKRQTLDHIQALAAAVVVHSMYTGIESILQMLHKMSWGRLPETGDWHVKLLQAFSDGQIGAPITIPTDVLKVLIDLLGFRHRFRHGYAHRLDDRLVTEKLLAAESIWETLRAQLVDFMGNQVPPS